MQNKNGCATFFHQVNEWTPYFSSRAENNDCMPVWTCHSLLLHDPNCPFLRMIKVISSPEPSSWRHNTASRLSVPLQALDDVLKELHGRHYIFILFRIEEQMKETCVISSLLHVKSVWYWIYLLAGFYEFINRHHSISVPIHFLKKLRCEKDAKTYKNLRQTFVGCSWYLEEFLHMLKGRFVTNSG